MTFSHSMPFMLTYLPVIYPYQRLRAGWKITHIIDTPLSIQRFQPKMVTRMQKNRTLGVVRRSLIIGKKR